MTDLKSDVILCISDISFLKEPRAFDSFIPRVSPERAQKACSYESATNRAHSLGAGLLLNEALRRFFAQLQNGAPTTECDESMMHRSALDATGNPLMPRSTFGETCSPFMPRCAHCTKACDACSLVGTRASCKSDTAFVQQCAPRDASCATDTLAGKPCPLYGGRALSALPAVLVANGNAKPFLQAFPCISISLSHSGDYAACAVSRACTVGVDIEHMRSASDGVMHKCCTQSEYDAIVRAKTPEERNAAFCTLWTQKESYIKATGEGLAVSLNTVSVNGADGSVSRGGEKTPFYCRTYSLAMPYALSLCCSWPVFPPSAEFVSLQNESCVT